MISTPGQRVLSCFRDDSASTLSGVAQPVARAPGAGVLDLAVFTTRGPDLDEIGPFLRSLPECRFTSRAGERHAAGDTQLTFP